MAVVCPRAVAPVIGSGFGRVTDPDALVIGPTGPGLGPGGTLYVADTLASRIAAIPRAMLRSDSAGTLRRTVSEGAALGSVTACQPDVRPGPFPL